MGLCVAIAYVYASALKSCSRQRAHGRERDRERARGRKGVRGSKGERDRGRERQRDRERGFKTKVNTGQPTVCKCQIQGLEFRV